MSRTPWTSARWIARAYVAHWLGDWQHRLEPWPVCGPTVKNGRTVFILVAGGSLATLDEGQRLEILASDRIVVNFAAFYNLRGGEAIYLNEFVRDCRHAKVGALAARDIRSQALAQCLNDEPDSIVAWKLPARRRLDCGCPITSGFLGRQGGKCPPDRSRLFRMSYPPEPLELSLAASRSSILARSGFWTRPRFLMSSRGGSANAAIFLAAQSGAERIVICGLDGGGPYFWEVDPSVAAPWVRIDELPKSADVGMVRTGIQNTVKVLSSVLPSQLGVDIQLGTSGGGLDGFVPQYTWGGRLS